MIRGQILVDTGPLVAVLSRRDFRHDECVEQFAALPAGVWTCWPVLTEAVHILRSPGPVNGLFDQLQNENIRLLPLDETDVPSIHKILERYFDQGFDLADACLMHLAEREAVDCVFTLDRRHFSIFRKSDGSALRLIPDFNT